MLERFMGGIPGVKLKFWNLWRQVALDHFNRYKSNNGIMSEQNAYCDIQFLYSGRNRVTAFYTLDEMPSTLPVGFTDSLRMVLASYLYVRVSFSSILTQNEINWGSSKIKSRVRTWEEVDEDNQDDGGAYKAMDTARDQDKIAYRKESLYYFADAKRRRNRNMYRMQTLMIVSGNRSEEFDSALRKVEKFCSDLGIKATRVTNSLDKYIMSFSPFTQSQDSRLLKDTGAIDVTDEIMARFNTYTQGQVGEGPIYWGTDVYSNFPVWNEIKRNSTDAENILIVAETGGGKSFFVKTLLLGILADSRFTGTIMDIEGFEYAPLENLYPDPGDFVRLNMAEGQGSYFDPVAVYPTGDPELDQNMLSTSKSYTVAILKTLMGEDASKNTWVNIIINDAVSKTYLEAGVTNDPKTWTNTQGLTLFDVYNTIVKLYEEGNAENYINQLKQKNDVSRYYHTNKNYMDARDLVLAQLSRYFDPNGTRRDVFATPVDIGTIRDAKMVVCSFGLAGKTEKTIDPIQMGLTQLYAANIAGLRSMHNQAKGLYTVKLWEEFQRWGTLPDSEKTITTALTGGRKLGDVNIIITNKVNEMLALDKFGLFESTTSFAIGAIADSKVREELAERLDIGRLLPDLNSIAVDSGDAEMNALMKHAFVVHPRKGAETIVKVRLPEEVANSPLFRTGVKQKVTTEEEWAALSKEMDEVLGGLSGGGSRGVGEGGSNNSYTGAQVGGGSTYEGWEDAAVSQQGSPTGYSQPSGWVSPAPNDNPSGWLMPGDKNRQTTPSTQPVPLDFDTGSSSIPEEEQANSLIDKQFRELGIDPTGYLI